MSDEVLILQASCGGGHAAAARAVAKGFAQLEPGVPVRVVDALDFMTPGFRRTYLRSFELSVAYTPSFYGAFFSLTRDVDRSPVARAARALYNRTHGQPLLELLRAASPRAVVCTHFLPLEMALRERARGGLDAPVYAVVTDYVAHGLWRQPRAELTFCPPGRAKLDLRRGGVPTRRVIASGIPVDPACGDPYEAATAKRLAGLAPDRPTVVLLAGAAGMGPLVAVLTRTARALAGAADLVVVCGRNEALRAEVARAARGLPGRIVVRGFVSPVLDLLRGADVVVTKPGGLTTSECLALGKPTVFYEAAPGQESANAAHVVALGGGVLGGDPAGTARATVALVRDSAARGALAAAARRGARPHAALEVAGRVLATSGGWLVRERVA